jgi:hypothetical protein
MLSSMRHRTTTRIIHTRVALELDAEYGDVALDAAG